MTAKHRLVLRVLAVLTLAVYPVDSETVAVTCTTVGGTAGGRLEHGILSVRFGSASYKRTAISHG